MAITVPHSFLKNAGMSFLDITPLIWLQVRAASEVIFQLYINKKENNSPIRARLQYTPLNTLPFPWLLSFYQERMVNQERQTENQLFGLVWGCPA